MENNIQISIIVARSKNHCIGKNGDLPFRLKSDLQNFKKLTLNKPIIMGRKTFQSLPKLLPNRVHYVISRDFNFSAQGAFVYSNLETALSAAKARALVLGLGEICIIGGGEIYSQSQDYADIIHLTEVECEIAGDTFFEIKNPNHWQEVEVQKFQKNDDNQYDFEIITYKCVKN